MVTFTNIKHYFEENGCTRVVSFSVIGKPPVQQRPKITYKKKTIPIYYDPSNTLKSEWRLSLKTELEKYRITIPVFGSDPLVDNEITLEMIYFMERPKTDFVTKKKIKTLKKVCHKFPNKKDIDNMTKFCMDAMQGVLYENDCAICCIDCRKKFIEYVGEETDDVPIEPTTNITIKQKLTVQTNEL